MIDEQKMQKCRSEFVNFWESKILPNLDGQFFLIEKTAEIKNLAWLCWLESAQKKAVDK